MTDPADRGRNASWIAAGIRHEVLLRVLPALRHDMVAPVSVARMSLILLKRQLATSPLDTGLATERIAVLEEQVGQVASAMRLLRGWEGNGESETLPGHDLITRADLVAECVHLLRPGFEMHGQKLQIDAALLPAEVPIAESERPGWPGAAALRYLLLAALCHLQDTRPMLSAIALVPEGDAMLVLKPHRRDAPAPTQETGAPTMPIDALVLRTLADDLGFELHIAADELRLSLAR